ncbi:hypothetical protein IPJ91_01145 [bacterium]|nr:MAG: hypothetical protein IPJ91_01145 [bacterium]
MTNLAKCTQIDAKPLKDKVFRNYLDLMYQELSELNPSNTMLFGNQVSSIVLNKRISVSKYQNLEFEMLNIGEKEIKCFPMYYPVGMGMMNMPKVINSLKLLIGK